MAEVEAVLGVQLATQLREKIEAAARENEMGQVTVDTGVGRVIVLIAPLEE